MYVCVRIVQVHRCTSELWCICVSVPLCACVFICVRLCMQCPGAGWSLGRVWPRTIMSPVMMHQMRWAAAAIGELL